ncbi:LytTR family transcriptional regulator [Polaribacter sp.]|nr:LytTR family transcriptional regulator [Polaribacter sp.]
MNIIIIDDYFHNEILSVTQEQYLKINEINLYRYKDITTALDALKDLIFKADGIFFNMDISICAIFVLHPFLKESTSFSIKVGASYFRSEGETTNLRHLIDKFNVTILRSKIDFNTVKNEIFELSNLNEEKKTIQIYTNKGYHIIDVKSILCAVSRGDYIKLITTTESHIVYSTIKDFLVKLPLYFKRIHRSSVVNLKKVLQVSFSSVVLRNNIIVPLSKNKRAKTIEELKLLIEFEEFSPLKQLSKEQRKIKNEKNHI